MADYNLGTARGTIELTYRDNGSTGRARNDIDSIGGSATRSHKAMLIAGTAIAGIGVAVAGGLAVAVNAAANFDAKLSEIQAVSGNTTAQMELIRAKALQLGKDTVFSAGGAADAMIELSKAGVSTADILAGAADATVALASAGGIDLPAAATIASNAMNQFQLSAKDMPKIADLIAGAANASAIDVTDFGNSLAYVGPVAKTLGISISDTASAIAILGNQGIKGSAAGTALRSIFAQLTPSTKKATAAFQDLGLITEQGANLFYDATGKMKPLDQVVQILHDHTKQLTQQQKVAFTKKAFGTEDLAAVSILLGQTGKSFDAMNASIGKTTAADVAKTKMNNLKGSVEQFKGSLETLEIQAGEKLQAPLKKLTDLANTFLGVLIDLVSSEAIAKFFTNVSDKVTAFMAVLQSAGPTVSRIWSTVVGLFQGDGGGAGGGPSFFDKVKAGVAGIIASVQDAYVKILPIVIQIVAAFAEKWDQYGPQIMTAISKVKDIIVGILDLIATDIRVWVAVITFLWDTFGATILTLVTSTFGNIFTFINGILTVIQGVINLFVGIFTGDWSRAWLGIQQIFNGVWNAILAILRLAVAVLHAILSLALDGFKKAFSLAWAAMVAVVSAAWDKITGLASAGGAAVGKAVSDAWNAVTRGVSTAWAAVTGAVSTAIDKVVTTVASLKDKLIGALADAGTWLVDIGRRLIQGIIDGIGGMKDQIIGALKDLIPGGGLLGKAAGVIGLSYGRSEQVGQTASPQPSSPYAAADAINAAFATSAGTNNDNRPVNVKVFIGETELTDIVRIEVEDTLAPLSQITKQGGI